MANRDDILRHWRIAQHAFVQREKSQFLEALVPSSSVHAEASTFGDHIFPPSSSRKKRVSPSDASLPPSFRS